MALLFACVLSLLTTPTLAGDRTATVRYTAKKIISMLETDEIASGTSDKILVGEEYGISVSSVGNYKLFSIQGLDVADNITLISEGGRFFYAHYGSCSKNINFFKVPEMYSSYVSKIR